MAELQLERTPGERRVYALEGLGTLRLTGLTSRTGVAEAGGRRWELGRRRPGLLLFAAFVVRRLAEDAGGAAAGVGAPSTGA